MVDEMKRVTVFHHREEEQGTKGLYHRLSAKSIFANAREGTEALLSSRGDLWLSAMVADAQSAPLHTKSRKACSLPCGI